MSDLIGEIVKVILLFIVELIFDILFIMVFCDVIGRFTRYGFLRFIGQKVTLDSLSTTNESGSVNLTQALFNFFSAMTLVGVVFVGFVYL